MTDATLEEAASVEEQPASEAVVSETPGSELAGSETTDASTPVEQPPSRLWAGKYKTPEEMEQGYLETSREGSRMAGELAAQKRTPTADTPSLEPKWKQLEGERNKWAAQLRNPNASEQERYQADDQVRLYDREIAEQKAFSRFEAQTKRSGAETRLESEAAQVMSQYQHELADMNSTFYQSAAQRLQDLKDMGLPDTNSTKAMAVAYAAAITGTQAKQLVKEDRKTLLKTLNTQAKQAVVAGAGGPTAVKSGGITAKDIDNMSDKEFLKWEREQLKRA